MKLRNSYIQVRRELDGELTFGATKGFLKWKQRILMRKRSLSQVVVL